MRWRLPRLVPKLARHWVKKKMEASGMSDFARDLHGGWTPKKDGGASNYGALSIEEVLAEHEACLPEGPFGTVRPPRLEVSRIGGDILAEVRAALAAGTITQGDLLAVMLPTTTQRR